MKKRLLTLLLAVTLVLGSSSVTAYATETTVTETAVTETAVTEAVGTEAASTNSVTADTSSSVSSTADNTGNTDTAVQIYYYGNGGSGTMSMDSFSAGGSGALTANKFTYKGYEFTGWNTKLDGTGTTYADHTDLTSLLAVYADAQYQGNAVIKLYAQWKISVHSITYVMNAGTNNVYNPATYDVNTSFTLLDPVRNGYEFAGWFLDTAFTQPIKVIDSSLSKDLIIYAKWTIATQEYTAKSSSGKITACAGSGVDEVLVTAQIPRRLKSSDKYYYLVTIDPTSGKKRLTVDKAYKDTMIAFRVDTSENPGLILGKYAVAVKNGSSYKVISKGKYVKDPENTSDDTRAYETGSTKKGIQYGCTPEQIIATGAKNTLVNLYVSTVMASDGTTWTYNGKTYSFNGLGGYVSAIKKFNNAGVNVSLQINLDYGDGTYSYMIDKSARSSGHIFYTWNTREKKGREAMEALFTYLAKKLGSSDGGCQVDNWILGNEVNSYQKWNYPGTMSQNEFVKAYTYAFRTLYNATKHEWANSKTFLCLDHNWSIAENGVSGKTFLNLFSKELKSQQSSVNFNIAYHPYPNPYTSADFWNNGGISKSSGTSYVNMKNISALTNYVRAKYGRTTRIILTEQGYTAKSGEKVQAAAIAYSYNIAACNNMIDASIIRAYSDNSTEVKQGLSLGITGRAAYKVFRYMDTSAASKYTNKYLKVIGASNWSSIVPGYNKSYLTTNYRK